MLQQQQLPLDFASDKVKCVTYWDAAVAPPVTQAEAAVKIHVLVFTLR